MFADDILNQNCLTEEKLLTCLHMAGDKLDQEKKIEKLELLEYRARLRALYDAKYKICRHDLDESLRGTIFLSYQFNYDKDLEWALKKVEPIAERLGYKVATALSNRQSIEVLDNTLINIKTSDALLCLMTPEAESRRRKASSQKSRQNREAELESNSPSGWLTSEIAMAMALEKPFTIIVHEAIAPGHWERIHKQWHHSICKKETGGRFDDKLEILCEEAIRLLDLEVTRRARDSLSTKIRSGMSSR